MLHLWSLHLTVSAPERHQIMENLHTGQGGMKLNTVVSGTAALISSLEELTGIKIHHNSFDETYRIGVFNQNRQWGAMDKL